MGTSGYTTKRYIAPYPTKVQLLSSSLKWTVNYLASFPIHKLLLVALPLTYWVLFLLPILSTNASHLKFATVFCFVAHTGPNSWPQGSSCLNLPSIWSYITCHCSPLPRSPHSSTFFFFLSFLFLWSPPCFLCFICHCIHLHKTLLTNMYYLYWSNF